MIGRGRARLHVVNRELSQRPLASTFTAMCGIAGSFGFSEKTFLPETDEAVKRLYSRGPDSQGVVQRGPVTLASARLRIIDTTDAGYQPMSDESGRYTIVFNGEIYNFKELRSELLGKGFSFQSGTDTEVLLKGYAAWGESVLDKLNGFFGFAIYDKQEGTLFVARDRFGIKPLLYASTEDGFFFASEMKALLCYPINRELDRTSLLQYLHLNYIPAPHSVFANVSKLQPGESATVTRGQFRLKKWYEAPKRASGAQSASYDEQKAELAHHLETSVKRRLIADVPLGAFLSGGIDSSVVVALAAQHTSRLKTFSIGFPDHPYFDETEYAKLVANLYATDHTVFNVTPNDLIDNLDATLDYIDEPFADSSMLLVNLLSRQTAHHVTVALSGDGSDELFAGYRKHRAEWRIRRGGVKPALVKALGALWKVLPQSREGRLSDRVRQLHRFSQAAKLTPADRYWRLCGYTETGEASALLNLDKEGQTRLTQSRNERISTITKELSKDSSLSTVLSTDREFILPNDMLHKVDLMSMAHSLEVRVPFLDHDVVEFAEALPIASKINGATQKRVVKDTFAHMLPPELLTRPKKGFEVPLLSWLRQDLKAMLDDYFSVSFLKKQGLFDPQQVGHLRSRLESRSPGDAAARIFGLFIFQKWWLQYNC